MDRKDHGLTITRALNPGEEINIETNGMSVTVPYTIEWTAIRAQTNPLGKPHPQYSWLTLQKIKITRAAAGLAKCVEYYAVDPDKAAAGDVPIPKPFGGMQGATLEVDIRQFPTWETELKPDWDETLQAFRTGSEFYGIERFFVGSATWQWTDFVSSRPSTSDLSDLGKRSRPEGLSGGTSENWLLIGLDIDKDGAYWRRHRSWLYSAKPWNTTIYP